MLGSGALCKPILCLGFGFLLPSHFWLTLVHHMSNYFHLCCLPGWGRGQKYSRAEGAAHTAFTGRYSCAVQANVLKGFSLACNQAQILVPSMTLALESPLWLVLQQGVKWCRLASLKIIHPASDTEELLTVSFLFGHCSGLHMKTNCLRQSPNASATAFISMARVICSAWMGLTSIWQISAPLGSIVKGNWPISLTSQL